MRLDIVSAAVQSAGGQPKIRYELVLWGAQREMREDAKLKKMVTSVAFNVTWKCTDEKGKLKAEVNAPGDPAT